MPYEVAIERTKKSTVATVKARAKNVRLSLSSDGNEVTLDLSPKEARKLSKMLAESAVVVKAGAGESHDPF